MPRMLSLLIWHKGSWHDVVLTEGVEVERNGEESLGELGDVLSQKALN